MWLSKTIALRQRAEEGGPAADMGVTTIGGGRAAVMTRGEQRDLEVFAPGGVAWQPQAGDTVLVVRGGTGSQEQCVVAAGAAACVPAELAPGELYLYSRGGASIYLRGDGSIRVAGPVELEGPVRVAGSLTVNGQAYRPCQCGESGGSG